MKRLARHLFTLASAASLLLCVAVCVLWARSYHRSSGVAWTASDGDPAAHALFTASSGAGGMSISFERYDLTGEPPGWMWTCSELPPYGEWYFPLQTERFGFGAVLESDEGGAAYGLLVPHWFVATLTAVSPAAWLWAHVRRRRRIVRGLCPACGYDLRASPARCPECGTTPEVTP